MNHPLSLEALQARAEENATFGRRRRRAAATALAGAAMLGLSMTACSSGGNDADAAATDSTVAAGTVTGPQFSQSGAPGMGPGGPGGQGGEVTAIDGSTITVENQGRDGTTTTLTVETSDDTTITATSDGTIDDLAVGDAIVAFGETGDDDEFVASRINDGMGAMGGPVFQVGDIPGGGIPGGGIPGGDGTGDMPPRVFTDGVAPDGSVPEPPAGAPTVGQPGGPMTGQLVSGTITEIGDSTITVETNDGTETVIIIDDDTAVTVAVDKSLSDIEVGSTIRVSGDDTDGTVAATSIVITET